MEFQAASLWGNVAQEWHKLCSQTFVSERSLPAFLQDVSRNALGDPLRRLVD